MGGRKTPLAQVAMGETTAGASGVFVQASEGETRPQQVAPGDPLQLAPVVFYLPPTGADTRLTLRQLALCGVFWWYIIFFI